MTWPERTHRWFVLYNPFYFASAMCVFAGVWLVAHGLPAEHFGSKAAVVAVAEAYQLLLIGGAWLLLRTGQRRPAAILGLLALVFALDVALNGERLFSHARTMSLEPGMRARVAVPASLAFALFGPVKLALLARVFRLRGVRPFLAVACTVVFLLPLLPYAVEAAGDDAARRQAHLFLFWSGAPLLGWALARPGWRAEEVDGPRALRIARAAPLLVLGLFLTHAALWSTFPGLGMSTAHAAPYVLVVFTLWAAGLGSRAAEPAAWIGAAGAIAAAATVPGALPLGATAILTAGALLALVRHRGLRLLLPAIVSGAGGVYLLSGATSLGLPWMLPLAAALTAAAAGHRDVRCLLGAGVATAVAVGVSPPLLPHAAMAGALWVAATSWLILPERRRWLPLAALALFLAAGVLPLRQEPALNALGYLAASGLALALGLGFRWTAYTIVGVAGVGTVAVVAHSIYAPRSALSWGLLLLAFGFALLAAGVVYNLRHAARMPLGRV